MSNHPKRNSINAGSIGAPNPNPQQAPAPGQKKQKRQSLSGPSSMNTSISEAAAPQLGTHNSSIKRNSISGRSTVLDFSDFEVEEEQRYTYSNFFPSFCQKCLGVTLPIRLAMHSLLSYVYNNLIVNCLSVFAHCTSHNILSHTKKEYIKKHILSSNIYITVLVCMIIYLFFGSFISDLYCPDGYQGIFDAVSVVVLLCLMLDIVLRCLAEENYFTITCPCLRFLGGGIVDGDARSVSSAGSVSGYGSSSGTGAVGGSSGGYGGISFGSAYFWFDLISSVTILFEISFINTKRFGVVVETIVLHTNDKSWKLPRETKNFVEFIFIVGQTLRVSRLVGIMIKHQLYNLQTIVGSRYNPCSASRIANVKQRWFKKEHAAITVQRWWRRRQYVLSNRDISRHMTEVTWSRSHKQGSQVGKAMREMTAQRVSIGLLVAIICSYLFTFVDTDNTRYRTMVMLHLQTTNMPSNVTYTVIQSARDSAIPTLYQYIAANGDMLDFPLRNGLNPSDLRPRDKLTIFINATNGNRTQGRFSNEAVVKSQAAVFACYSAYVIILWLIGVSAFIGPVMTLVVHPIERMTRLLTMLMVNPLGYQDTLAFKDFEQEGREFPQKSGWSEEELKGMETTFLLSTILRIGSLMKVGFGSAGAEIIRNSLSDAQSGNTFNLDQCGSITSCIFMFCDIRQFTDVTECLQEEVFVFTNKIASVIHSFVSAYGGSANTNIGDAFLVSWQLNPVHENGNNNGDGVLEGISPLNGLNPKLANKNQADRALLAVIKIQVALFVDHFYLQELSDVATKRLLEKLATRPGPKVQIGFGLHAGKAVQGAIGSHRKIDPSYISEAVELSEFLESSTKRYGVSLLMSGAFYSLLHPTTARRCRKIDSVLISDNDEIEDQFAMGVDIYAEDNIMDLYTFDIDVKRSWEYRRRQKNKKELEFRSRFIEKSLSSNRIAVNRRDSRRLSLETSSSADNNISSNDNFHKDNSTGGFNFNKENSTGTFNSNNSNKDMTTTGGGEPPKPDEVILPTASFFFSLNDFTTDEMRSMVAKYSDGLFYHTFQSGLRSFYNRDWDHAQQCFQSIVDRMIDDGPSKYYLKRMAKTNGIPPRNFKHYNTMD